MKVVLKGREPLVVDTNVLILANNREGVTLSCAAKCATRLYRLMHSGAIVLDANGLIVKEYKRYLNFSGQPGAGDAFFRWLVNNRYRKELCHIVNLTEVADEAGGYEEFPAHEGLLNFDPADKKFVAAANVHPSKPPILQALDSKWLVWARSLAECEIIVDFVCLEEILLFAGEK